jgi:O-antigen/teichoic acid export membrane protein
MLPFDQALKPLNGNARLHNPIGLMNLAYSLREKALKAASIARLRPFDTATPEGRSRERYRRIGLNTLTSLLNRGLTMGLNIIAVPLTLRYLGKERYAFCATVASLTMWVAVFNFGAVNSLVNLISEAHGKDDSEAARRHVSTAFFLLVAITCLAAVGFVLLLPIVKWDSVFAVQGLVPSEVVKWSVIAGVTPVLFNLPLSIAQQIYAGYQKSYTASLLSSAGPFAGIAGLFLAVHFKASLPILILVLGCAPPIASALSLVYLTGIDLPWLRPQPSLCSLDSLRRLLRTSVPLFLLQVGALLVNQTQLIIMAHRSTLETVADYSVINRFYVFTMGVISLSTYSFLPPFREAFERGEQDWVRLNFRRMVFLRMTMATAASVLSLVAGNLVLRMWLRSGSMVFTTKVWAALGILLVSATWVTAFSDLLTIMDKIWIQTLLVCVNGVGTGLLTFILTPVFGVLGAIAALSFVTLFMWSWLVPVIARPLLKPV